MTPEPTFFVLDGVQGWRQAAARGVRQEGLGVRSVLTLDPSPGGKGLSTKGRWFSEPLDSGIANCLWHRIELDVTLPAGCSIKVATATNEAIPPEGRCAPNPSWIPAFVATGAPSGHRGKLVDSPGNPCQEGLVQSRGGRYLRLCLELTGDHQASPRIRSIRIRFPRRTWLDQLPAVFSAGAERRDFLDRFLSIFHTPWNEIQGTLDTFYHYLDPKAVPEDFLDTLASWLGQPLEGEWPAWKNRRLLASIPDLLPWRGTTQSIQRLGAVYLANLTGRSLRGVQPFPIVVENQRRHRLTAGSHLPAGSLGTTGHLELGAREAEGSTAGSDTAPPYEPYSFLVVVPAAWIDSDEKRLILERAIEQEKPAATRFALWLLEGGIRAGQSSTVGVDTLIAPPAPAIPPGDRSPPSEERT